jgi:hypothetical protein
MPIATCYVTAIPDDLDPDEIVAEWSTRSGIEPAEMTVNLVATRRGGKRYAAMAWLYLPSLWPDEAVVALSTGLAAALADALGVAPSSVQVVTSIVESGMVVEAGEIARW